MHGSIIKTFPAVLTREKEKESDFPLVFNFFLVPKDEYVGICFTSGGVKF